MTRHSKFRACPLCEAICGLELQFEDEKLVAIRGDDADPFSRGHICPKGNAILDLESDPDRLRKPMRRIGNEWHEISWDEAFTLAGEKLAETQNTMAPTALARIWATRMCTISGILPICLFAETDSKPKCI